MIDLLSELEVHDALVVRCASGEVSFGHFCEMYDSFYARAALDGHEATPHDRALFARFEPRLRLHERIWREVLSRVTSDDLLAVPGAIEAGFIGSEQAVRLIRTLASNPGCSVIDRALSAHGARA